MLLMLGLLGDEEGWRETTRIIIQFSEWKCETYCSPLEIKGTFNGIKYTHSSNWKEINRNVHQNNDVHTPNVSTICLLHELMPDKVHIYMEYLIEFLLLNSVLRIERLIFYLFPPFSRCLSPFASLRSNNSFLILCFCFSFY